MAALYMRSVAWTISSIHGSKSLEKPLYNIKIQVESRNDVAPNLTKGARQTVHKRSKLAFLLIIPCPLNKCMPNTR